jgi:hypothetical protein
MIDKFNGTFGQNTLCWYPFDIHSQKSVTDGSTISYIQYLSRLINWKEVCLLSHNVARTGKS